MRTILHADDFGVSHKVNENILAVWHAGCLDSVSVIANGGALFEAATEVNIHSDRLLRLVVHLNLCEGFPIADPRKVPLLVDGSGQFHHGFWGIWKEWAISQMSVRKDLLQQVELEWREQIRRVVDAFAPRSVLGVDGHVHIHMVPMLFPIAVKLAQEFGLNEIRISRELFYFSFKESCSVGFLINVFKHLLLNALSYRAKKIVKRSGMTSPDAIAGVIYSGFMTKKTACAAIKAARRANVEWLEILFHPGRAAPEEAHRWSHKPSIGKFYLDARRDVERDALIDFGGHRRLCHIDSHVKT